MRRFRDYYRQFEELPPEELSRELRARRDEERRRALSRSDALDLSGTTWHEPPHPEAVNAATFALRRALNAYPDAHAGALRAAVAERHGVAPERVANRRPSPLRRYPGPARLPEQQRRPLLRRQPRPLRHRPHRRHRP